MEKFSNFFAFIGKRSPRLLWLLKGYHKGRILCDINKPHNLFAAIGREAIAHGDDPLWARSADKWEVRGLIAETIGDKYLIPAYGHWHNPDDIDFDTLPSSFALKTTNGCATNIIVTDKSKLNYDEAKKRLKAWDIKNYALASGQPHYSHVPYGLIAEELLVEPGHPSPADWKFYCVNGKPEILCLVTDREEGAHFCPVCAYDMDFNPMPDFTDQNLYTSQNIKKPACWNELKEIVTKLAAPHRIVRIDFYVVDNKPYFGEITLTPGPFGHLSPQGQKYLFDKLSLAEDSRANAHKR